MLSFLAPGSSGFMMSPRERVRKNFHIQASGCHHDRALGATPTFTLHLPRAACLVGWGGGGGGHYPDVFKDQDFILFTISFPQSKYRELLIYKINKYRKYWRKIVEGSGFQTYMGIRITWSICFNAYSRVPFPGIFLQYVCSGGEKCIFNKLFGWFLSKESMILWGENILLHWGLTNLSQCQAKDLLDLGYF